MADTRRDLAAILALFADNTAGAISPQDLRDGTVTWLGTYGSMLVTAGSTSQGSLSSTPAKLTGWDTNGISAGVTPDFATDDDLTVTVAGNYRIYFHLGFTPTASETYIFEIYKNAAVTAVRCQIDSVGATTDTIAASMEGVLTLAASDLLTVFVHTVGAAAITPLEGQFGCQLIG